MDKEVTVEVIGADAVVADPLAEALEEMTMSSQTEKIERRKARRYLRSNGGRSAATACA